MRPNGLLGYYYGGFYCILRAVQRFDWMDGFGTLICVFRCRFTRR